MKPFKYVYSLQHNKIVTLESIGAWSHTEVEVTDIGGKRFAAIMELIADSEEEAIDKANQYFIKSIRHGIIQENEASARLAGTRKLYRTFVDATKPA